MRRAKYQPTDEAFCIRLCDCAGRYAMSEQLCREIAENAGALIKIGKSVRVIVSVMDDYLMGMPKATRTANKRACYKRYIRETLDFVEPEYYEYEDVNDLCERYRKDLEEEAY